MRIQAFVILLCLFPGAGWADAPLTNWADAEGEMMRVPEDTLGTAIVTAPGLRREVSSITLVQRIDSTAIRTQGITDMGDALRRLSGVNVRDYGGAGGLKTVSVRSLGPSHTVVTYDGLAVSDTQQGQIDLQRFQFDRLSSIELLTLDNATLLCPAREVAAAVVSLKSAMPTALPDGRWHGTAALRQGSWQSYAPSLSVAHAIGHRSAVSLSADYTFALNDYPFHVSNGAASETLRRTNSRMQSVTAEANWRHTTRGGATLEAKQFAYYNHRRLPGQVILYVNSNNERQTEQNHFSQFRFRHTCGRWAFLCAARYNWQESLYTNIDAQYPDGVLRQNYWQREAYATAALSFRLTPTLHLASATDYAYATLTSNLPSDSHVARHTLLEALSLQWKTGRWQLTARALGQYGRDHLGALKDNAPAGSSREEARKLTRVTPSLTASVMALRRPFHLYLRAGAKETYRRPTFTESYFYHLGSASLRPERTRQVSAGVTLQAAPTGCWPLLSLTADGYVNRVDDRIVSVPVNLQLWRTVNLGLTRAHGVDLTFHSQLRLARRHGMDLSLNYSWQHATNERSQGTIRGGLSLPYTPLHSGAASAAWTNPWANFVVHTTFASRRWSTLEHMQTTSLPPYSEWGFALYRSFTLPKRMHLDARADLVNAFNRSYEIIRRYPMPGRSYKLSLSLTY